MRVALVGAFPFPYPQGSQVYVAEQARALAGAGAETQLVTYPAGRFQLRGRSGPSLAKPFADGALIAHYVAEHRRHRFDAALAHNAEAAVAAIVARPATRVPVIYVAHTLLAHELSAYASDAWRTWLDPLGAAVDRWIARRADAIVALSEDARGMLAPWARGPIEVIPPGLDPGPAPDADARIAACRDAGVEPQRFAMYAGNLDDYQDLDVLDAAAALLRDDPPILVVTHDARDGAQRYRHLRVVERERFEDVRALSFSAGALVLTRHRPGGFPIKLLNYMETGRPIVARRRIAPGLENGVTAVLLPESAGATDFERAIRRLRDEPTRATALGTAAREHLLARHAWRDLAARTLDLVGRVSGR